MDNNKIYVLDSSVILHNWNVLKEQRISIIPRCVLDDIQKFQEQLGDVGDNARSARYWLSKQLQDMTNGNEIHKNNLTIIFWKANDKKNHDEKVLFASNEIKNDERFKNYEIIILTKSLSLRVKAKSNGFISEDYDDVGLIEQIDGWRDIELNESELEIINNSKEQTFYLDNKQYLGINEYINVTFNGQRCKGMTYRHLGNGNFKKLDPKPHMASIVPKNAEQVMLADALLDPAIELVSMIGCAGSGKALINGSKVLTQNGYVKIEELKIGDKVFGNDGELHNILGIFPQGKKRVYEVHFTDGTIIKCNDEHLWTYQTRSMRHAGKSRNKSYWKTETLREIIDKQKYQENNIYLPIPSPLKFKQRQLFIKSYTMGAMIGDGCITQNASTFSSQDEDVINKMNNELADINCFLRKISKYDYRIIKLDDGLSKGNIFDNIIEEMGMRGKHSWEKYIPDDYLFNSIENRLELLKGLIDTNGYINRSGAYQFYTASEKLKQQVKFLAESLGCVVFQSEDKDSYKGQKKEGRKLYKLCIKCGEIEKLHFSQKRENQWHKSRQMARRTIANIIQTDQYEDMTCIYIDSQDHLFLTDSCIPTHNTLLAIASAIQQVLIKHNYRKIIITRPIMPIGRDLGYLPGDVDEKMAEWVRPFMNNIQYIMDANAIKGKNKISTNKVGQLLHPQDCKGFFEILPITYIRGSSISNAFIIVDEAQNATPSEMKTIITRVGENSKLVLTGDINQIDNRFLSRECNGLTMTIKKFWNHNIYSHITLKEVQRSKLAELATKLLF